MRQGGIGGDGRTGLAGYILAGFGIEGELPRILMGIAIVAAFTILVVGGCIAAIESTRSWFHSPC